MTIKKLNIITKKMGKRKRKTLQRQYGPKLDCSGTYGKPCRTTFPPFY